MSLIVSLQSRGTGSSALDNGADATSIEPPITHSKHKGTMSGVGSGVPFFLFVFFTTNYLLYLFALFFFVVVCVWLLQYIYQ